MREIRVGVIGVGNVGTMHARNVYQNKISGMKLTAICDINESRLEYCHGQFDNIMCYNNYMGMLKDHVVDAVVIAVPHPLHVSIAIEALQAGLHVMVEKPIGVTLKETQKLVSVAEQSNKIFAIMFNQRTNPLFQKARSIVREGLLGELKRSTWIITNWYRTQQYYDSGDWRATWSGEGGGILMNQAPHNLDLWQWICGMPETVRAFCTKGKYHNIEVEDEATIYTTYKNGATGVFIATSGEYPGTNRLEIVGDKGKIVLEQGLLKWWRLEQSEREICFSETSGSPKIPYDYQEFSYEENQSGHMFILQNFANAILHEEPLISPGKEGILQLELTNAAYLSEWLGNSKISLPMDSEMFDSLLKERCRNSAYRKQETVSVGEPHHSRWQVQW